MRKIPSLLVSFSLIFSLSAGIISAQGETPTEKAIQGVKDTVGALIDAKDNNDPKEAGARLDAYEKVLTLALADAKELKVKLLAFEGDKDKTTTTATLWKKDRVEALVKAIEYYEDEEDAIGLLESPSVDDLKARAEALKQWRGETYLPLAEEIQAFLLIEQQKKSLDTSKKRLEKISADVQKLKKAKFKEIKSIEEKFKNAESLIGESEKINVSAERNFQKQYLLVFMEKSDPLKIALLKEIREENDAAKKASASPVPHLSIKEQVDGSFAKVKDAYQVFIEMSDLVRKSL